MARAKRRETPLAKPGLDDLHGMDQAKAWGLALAADLKAYKAGTLAWQHVDRGALCSGPPGVGKTMFAQALAVTCHVPLITTSYADWQRAKDGHLGDLLDTMHRRFEEARRCTPCILFIDELDAIPSRAERGHHQRWWNSVVSALNDALDGVAARDGVVVVGAANYPERLDPALIRAGRLEQRLQFQRPSLDSMIAIIRFHLGSDLPDADLRPSAVALTCRTGAEAALFVRLVRRLARQQGRHDLREEDLATALDQTAAATHPDLRDRVAIHETGHAVAALLLGVSRNVAVSIVHEDHRAGATFFDPEPVAVTLDVVERRIAVMLAGRAAERELLGDIGAGSGGGAFSDLAQANQLAFHAVASWGLAHPEHLHWYGDCPPEQLMALRPELAEHVMQLLQRANARAVALIKQRRKQVRPIADALLNRLALAHEDIAALLGPDPDRSVIAFRRKKRT